MHILQHSQPRPFFQGGASSDTRAFKPLPKPAAMQTSDILLLKPGMKVGGSVKFSGWYHPAMSLDQVATACSQSPIDDTDFLGNTALILATKKNKPAVVKLLLEKNANINHQNQEQRTALMEASRKGHGHLVQLLLTHGADSSLWDAGNQTAQDLAANNSIKKQIQDHARSGETYAPQQRGGWGGWIKKGVIGLLLATAGKPALEYGYDQATGTTSLMKVAKSSGTMENAKKLIEQHWVNPIQKDIWGNTAQYYAEQAQNTQMAQYLEKIHTDLTNDFIFSAKRNLKDRASRLLALGLDINECNSVGNTALTMALKSNNRDMANYLDKQGATIDCNNNFKRIQKLIQRGDNLDRENAFGETPLMTVSRVGDMESLNALLDVGADVNKVNRQGYSALMLAAENGHDKAVQALLDVGADVNKVNGRGYSALMYAAENGHDKAVQALLDDGANVNQVSYKYDSGILALGTDAHEIHQVEKGGYSALMLAAKNGHIKTLQTLLDAGADPCFKDGFSRNAYDLATAFKHPRVAKILQKAIKENECDNPLRPAKKIFTTAKEYAGPAYEMFQTMEEIRQRFV